MSNAHHPLEYTLGIDLGGTKILAAVVDPLGKVLESAKRKTRADLGAEAVLDRVVRTAHEAITLSGIDPKQIHALGIGVPGPINSETGVVMEAPNLGFRNLQIKKYLEDRLHIPTGACNDVNAGTWGEYAAGAGRGASSCLGVFVGTGIGAGIVIDKKLYEGAGRLAGEIGHMVVDPASPVCGCGRRGCLEAVASRTAITRDIWAAIEKGQKSVLTELADKKGGQIRSGQLRRAYDEKDKVAVKAINKAAEYLGMGLASAASLLNPECIILSGGVVTALGAPYLERVRAAMAEHAFKSIIDSSRLIMGTLGDDAVILGAALLARDRIFSLNTAK